MHRGPPGKEAVRTGLRQEEEARVGPTRASHWKPCVCLVPWHRNQARGVITTWAIEGRPRRAVRGLRNIPEVHLGLKRRENGAAQTYQDPGSL